MNKPVSPNTFEPTPNNLEPFWMGFTPNRAFKQKPRLIARAKDMHYYDLKGRAILDGSAGSLKTVAVRAERWGRYPIQARVDAVAGGGPPAGAGMSTVSDVTPASMYATPDGCAGPLRLFHGVEPSPILNA